MLASGEGRLSELGKGDVVDGRYELEKVLGDEFLGRVWWARDQQRDRRPVRLKCMRPDHLTDDQRFRRFQREIEACARVRSPGVLPLLDSGVHASCPYAVFAAVPEESLADRVAAGPIPWREAVRLLAVVVVGLSALHREGVVHRDLVARNVLVDGEGRPWIRDLGLAWLVSTEDETQSLTDGDGRVGHLSAMAPEYLAQQQLSPAADLYALGILAFEMLTGAAPFEGQGNVLVRQTLGAVAPTPSSRVRDIPGWLDDLVLGLLDKDPARRPPPDAILARLQAGAAVPEAAAGRGRRWPVVLGGTGLLGAGIALGAWWVTSVSAPPPPEGLQADAPLPEPEALTERWLLPPVSPSVGPRLVSTASEAQASGPRIPESASAVIRSNQRVMVTLDGIPAGFSPIRLHAAPGPHQVVVVLPGRAESRREERVVFTEGEDRDLMVVF